MGDSISAGYGISIKQGWPVLLQARLNEGNYDYTVVNASVTGDTTSNSLARLPSLLKQYKPKITILELGGNDGLRGLQLFIIKKNLQEIIDQIKESNSTILLLGFRLPPNYGVAYTSQFQQMYPDLAKKNDIAIVPLFLKNVDDVPSLMQADGIHPNEQAQTILLNNVWAGLKNLLTYTHYTSRYEILTPR